jgi:hypothetical protein
LSRRHPAGCPPAHQVPWRRVPPAACTFDPPRRPCPRCPRRLVAVQALLLSAGGGTDVAARRMCALGAATISCRSQPRAPRAARNGHRWGGASTAGSSGSALLRADSSGRIRRSRIDAAQRDHAPARSEVTGSSAPVRRMGRLDARAPKRTQADRLARHADPASVRNGRGMLARWPGLGIQPRPAAAGVASPQPPSRFSAVARSAG